MDKITIYLSVDEVNAVLQTLGQLPTSSGAWPLLMNIREQAEAQAQGAPAAEPAAQE